MMTNRLMRLIEKKPKREHRVRDDLRCRDDGVADHHEHDVLEDEADPDRRDERRQARGVAQAPVGEPLDHHADDAHDDHRDGKREEKHAHEEEGVGDRAEKPSVVSNHHDTNEPHMKISPWAKLMSSMIP